MTAMREYVLALTLGLTTSCWGADQGVYSAFLSLVGTNAMRPVAIKSPLLVDTNNLAPKLANLVLSLADCGAKGEVGAIHLGMTMDEVIGSWGKPRHIWSRCWGGPLSSYGDASVVFDPSSNSVMRIFINVQKLAHLGGGLSA